MINYIIGVIVPTIYVLSKNNNQRTNGPVNAHLISWPSKAASTTVTFRSQAAIVCEKSTASRKHLRTKGTPDSRG